MSILTALHGRLNVIMGAFIMVCNHNGHAIYFNDFVWETTGLTTIAVTDGLSHFKIPIIGLRHWLDQLL